MVAVIYIASWICAKPCHSALGYIGLAALTLNVLPRNWGPIEFSEAIPTVVDGPSTGKAEHTAYDLCHVVVMLFK